MRALIAQMFRFGLVGLINAGVDLAVFFLALAALTQSLVMANVLAWIVAVSCSYVMNARFTFAASPRSALRPEGYFMFAFTQVFGFLAHTAVLVVAAAYVPLLFSKVLGIGVGFLVNFALARTFVFHAR